MQQAITPLYMPTVANLIDSITLLPLIDKDAIVHMNTVTLDLGDIRCVNSHLLNSHVLCLTGRQSNEKDDEECYMSHTYRLG